MTETMMQLLKIRLGIASDNRDVYLIHLLEATIQMLSDEKGIDTETPNELVTAFIIDFSAWRYESKGEQGGMPRHLQYALHNLMIHNQKVVTPIV